VDFMGLDNYFEGYLPIPPYHPKDEGKPRCCSKPADIEFSLGDDGSKEGDGTTPGMFHVRIIFTKAEGCFKSLQNRWKTCWRMDATGWWMPGFDQSPTMSFSSGSIDTYGSWLVGGIVRYLACEASKWTAHEDQKGVNCREVLTWSGRKLICD